MVTLYDEASAAAGDDFPHLRALANELQAEMWLERQQKRVARVVPELEKKKRAPNGKAE